MGCCQASPPPPKHEFPDPKRTDAIPDSKDSKRTDAHAAAAPGGQSAVVNPYAAPTQSLADPDHAVGGVETEFSAKWNSAQDWDVFKGRSCVEDQRWLFLDNTGTGWGAATGSTKVSIKNFTGSGKYMSTQATEEQNGRVNGDKGEVLWQATYDETPHYTCEGYKSTSSESWSSDGRGWGGRRHGPAWETKRKIVKKFRMDTKAKIRPVKAKAYDPRAGEWELKVKAKGKAKLKMKTVVTRDEQGNTHRRYEREETAKVKEIKYLLKRPDETYGDGAGGALEMKKKGLFRGGLHWDLPIFNLRPASGWNTKEYTCVTKPGYAPGMSLLVAHMLVTEYMPKEIADDGCRSLFHGSQFSQFADKYCSHGGYDSDSD